MPLIKHFIINMIRSKNILLHVAVMAAAAAIAGCGGGGGSDPTTGSTPTPTAPSQPALEALVTQVPAATYAGASQELAAFSRLNEQRGRCGFGLLAQNASLDQAASAHRNYLTLNRETGHGETPGLPGFTGATSMARANAAGYFGSIGEDVSAGGAWDRPELFPDGAKSAQTMLDLPYHATVVLGGSRDVGLAWGGSAFVINVGTATGVRPQSASGVRTYPCQGTVNVLPRLGNEIPSPFPNEVNPDWGPTVTVLGSQISVTKASITGPLGSVALKAVYTSGGTADPNGICKGNRACIIPEVLSSGTAYTVHIEGTDSGVAFTKDFTFTTAP